MTRNITFSSSIRPACLQTNLRDERSNVKLIVTGWGSTSTESELNPIKSIHFVNLFFYSFVLLLCFFFTNARSCKINRIAEDLTANDAIIGMKLNFFELQPASESCSF